MDEGTKRRVLPWIGLASILVIYVLSVLRINPLALFGMTQDDSLYFSSAKALANHRGYVLPSVPGDPIATKYPILYPWLLSWVWRWNPSFPSNLRDAAALTAAFGAMFLVSCFAFLRGLKGIGDSAAVLITFFVALHPIVLFHSASILSDIPFAALAFTAMLLADQAMRPDGTDARTAACAFLTGLSILMRAFGIPVAAGILAFAVARRAWRQIVIFCGMLVPFGCAVVWRWVFVPLKVPLVSDHIPQDSGFMSAWAYYTSYQGFWRLSVPNARILWAMLKNNALLILHLPSDCFLAPLLTRGNLLSFCLTSLVTAGIFAGIVRQSQGRNWKSIHWVLPFYTAVILVWNYPTTERFSILFLPLFAGGLWFEARHFLSLDYAAYSKSQSRTQKTLAGVLAFAFVALISALALNYVRGARTSLEEIVRNRSNLLEEKREAYQWLSCCTSRDDMVLAYEDASLYLYTGRQGMRPVVFPTSGAYDPVYVHKALEGITDVGRVIGARYWLIADDDFNVEYDTATSLGRAREIELEQNLPVVFQSHQGHIRIYRLGCDDRSKARLRP